MSKKRFNKIPKAKKHKKQYSVDEILNAKCCADHLRDFKETYNRQYPRSKHAPSCENYVTKNYKLVTIAGGKSFLFTEEWVNKANIKENSEGESPHITIKDILLTDDQIEKIYQ